MSRALAVAAVALASLASGCATGFASSASDFAAYRATRVAPTLEGRLIAAHRYLEKRPDGVFYAQVRAWFIHAEEVYFASKKGSRTGLAAYVETLPEGPHGEEAARRVEELDSISRDSQMDRLAAEVEARVSGPGAEARTRFRKELDAWLAAFLDPGVFGVPMASAKASLVIPFSLSLPSQRPARGRGPRSPPEIPGSVGALRTRPGASLRQAPRAPLRDRRRHRARAPRGHPGDHRPRRRLRRPARGHPRRPRPLPPPRRDLPHQAYRQRRSDGRRRPRRRLRPPRLRKRRLQRPDLRAPGGAPRRPAPRLRGDPGRGVPHRRPRRGRSHRDHPRPGAAREVAPGPLSGVAEDTTARPAHGPARTAVW